MISELQDFGRHAWGLRGYLREPQSDADCLAYLRTALAERESRFLDTVARGVFAQPSSPYRRLFAHAGIERGDLARLVADDGVDGTVERLYDAGVYVSIAEFRGLTPIERPGLSFPVTASDFDNPLVQGGWHSSTGGSRSLGRQVLLNFDHLDRTGGYFSLFLVAHGAADRPEAMWRPFAMRVATNNALRSSKRRQPIEKWFTPTAIFDRPFRTRDTALSATALVGSRLWASRIPFPEHVPFSDPGPIVEWLEGKARRGTPALVGGSVGSMTRICVAAQERGAEIAGTMFRGGGEPLTPARAEVVAATESTIFADYSMAELGRVGVSCAAPSAHGDVHLMSDKLALVQRARVVPATGETVGALLFTTLMPSAPKLMINVETDDYAVVEDRDCGCPIGELGYRRHLHGIRSYEKLTSDGVTMRGTDVLELLEQVLPGRFGGHTSDYQLVEEPDAKLPTLSVLVAPRVGPIDEREVVTAVLDALARGDVRAAEVSQLWRRAGTLRVLRREPFATPDGKVLPIHVLRR